MTLRVSACVFVSACVRESVCVHARGTATASVSVIVISFAHSFFRTCASKSHGDCKILGFEGA